MFREDSMEKMKNVLFVIAVCGLFTASLAGDPPVKTTGEDAHFAVFKQVALNFDRAWNGRNADALADLFTEDGDFRYWTGRRVEGRETIRESYARHHFPAMPEDWRHATQLLTYRFVSPDVVIADGTADITGTKGEEKEPFTLHLLFTCLTVKEGGQWKIAAIRLMVPRPD